MSAVIDRLADIAHPTSCRRVPAVTASFWIAAVLGTAAADGAVTWWTREARMGVGPLAVGITLTLGVLVVAKFRATRATPLLYWAVLAVANLAGVAYARVLVEVLRAPLPTATMFLALLLVSLLGTWLVDEGSVSQASVTSASRELSYWAAWSTSAALGAALTEWLVVIFQWGPVSTITAGLVIALVVLAGKSVGVGPTLCFWVGAVAIRPLGTSMVDWFASSPAHGGVGFGVGMASLVCLACLALPRVQ